MRHLNSRTSPNSSGRTQFIIGNINPTLFCSALTCSAGLINENIKHLLMYKKKKTAAELDHLTSVCVFHLFCNIYTAQYFWACGINIILTWKTCLILRSVSLNRACVSKQEAAALGVKLGCKSWAGWSSSSSSRRRREAVGCGSCMARFGGHCL